jgi:hypothetical protein
VVIPILCRRVFNSKLLSLAISRQNPHTQPSKNLNTRTTPSLTKNQEPPIISKTSQKIKHWTLWELNPRPFTGIAEMRSELQVMLDALGKSWWRSLTIIPLASECQWLLTEWEMGYAYTKRPVMNEKFSK